MKPHTGSGRQRGCEEQIAWLLRVNRVYGTNERFAVGINFVKAFRGRGFHRTIDAAQLTRWERGRQRVSYATVRRYEDLLNLPPHSLVAVADALHRTASATPGPSYLDRPAGADPQKDRERLERLIDQVKGHDVMTGRDWDELTHLLCYVPNIFLYPSTLWNDIVDRLLTEMIIADGHDWIQRSEGLHRLLGHPVGEPVVVAACAALAADPDNQIFIDPLTQLATSPHPDAATKIVGQVVDPTNEHAQRGAWLAAAEKARRGHFAPDDLHTLCRKSVELLTTDLTHPTFRLAVVELLRQSDYEASQPLASAVRRITRHDTHTRQLLKSGRMLPGEISETITVRAARTAMSMLPRDAMGEDPMFVRLLEAALFDPQQFVRVHATLLLRATPYRVPVAHALAVELTNRSILENPAIAPGMVNAVALLGDDVALRFLQRLVLAAGVPSFIAETAVWVLGHAAGKCPDAFWAKAIRRYQQNPGNIRGIIYGLGLNRNTPLLLACRGDSALSPSARRAAAWWLNIPDHILASTAKAGP